MKSSKKIVFFVASFSSIEATAPLGILAISTPLLDAGYEVNIIDSTITPNYKKTNHGRSEGCTVPGHFAGHRAHDPRDRRSRQGGQEMGSGFPDYSRRMASFPSAQRRRLKPHTSTSSFARRARTACWQWPSACATAAPGTILGIGFKRDGKIHFTPERPLKTLDKMPQKPITWRISMLTKRVCGRRWAMYVSSLACPFNCAYCTNAGVYGRKWNALPVEQVVEETIELTRRYRLELLWMADDNFLVDLTASLKIAEGLIRAGAKFKWSVQATTNLTARLTIEELTLLRRSGLHQICQGIETASPTVMKLMNKDFQVLGDIYQSTERCIKAGVIPSFNIIFGYPGEGPKERRETVNFMMDICQKFPGAEFWTNIFTPYPGSPIFHQAAKLGIEVPQVARRVGSIISRDTPFCPWLKGRDHQRVQTMRDYLRIAFDRAPIAANGPGRFAKAIQHLTAYPARVRIGSRFL